ncbi:EpsG family protein [Providencia sp. PROV037]|uniref:EpsG family protein n=1 Tax=Providencia sp. PROV037 TaxID=2949768 RepID=UPI003FA747E5
MKVKKKFLQKALLLLTSILFVFLYSSLIFNNHGVTDARNYYSFFQLIEDAGLIKFVSESYIASGKLEFVLYFFYLLISKFIEPNDFYLFTLANYTLIFSITLYAFYTYSRHFFNSKYLTVTLYSLLVSFSWFPSYLNMLWLWRTDLAYAILLCSFFFYITGRYLRFFILLIIAIFTHYSSIPIIIVLLCIYHFIKNIHPISLGIKKQLYCLLQF